MPQLVEARSNRQGYLVKRGGVGWFAKPGSKFFLFQQLFDLTFRQEPRTGVLDARENRLFPEIKDKSQPFLWRGYLRVSHGSRELLNANGREPAQPAERPKVIAQFRSVEPIAPMQRELRCDCCRRDVPQANELEGINEGSFLGGRRFKRKCRDGNRGLR
jgi:hypothetical protein